MIVKIKNLDIVERSVPTPANVSVTLEPNEVADFMWPAYDKELFDALAECDFSVETITQFSDVYPKNPDLDFSEIESLSKQCDGLILGTLVCDDDGEHIEEGEKYTTSEARESFVSAIEEALTGVQDATEQGAVDSSVESLTSAKEGFEGSIQTKADAGID